MNFIYGNDKINAQLISEVLAGRRPILVVAFLGEGAECLVPNGARVVCDISAGASSPKAIRALQKKLGIENVRHLPSLHAKIYWSESAAFVGSANLSSNGVFGMTESEKQGTLEAGIKITPEMDKLHSQIGHDCAKLFEAASKIGADDLRQLDQRWLINRRRTLGEDSSVKLFSIEDILASPKEYVISLWDDVSREVKENAQEINSELGLDGIKKRDKFYGWYLEEWLAERTELERNKFISSINERRILSIRIKYDSKKGCVASFNSRAKVQVTVLKYITCHLFKYKKLQIPAFYFHKHEWSFADGIELRNVLNWALHDKRWKDWFRNSTLRPRWFGQEGLYMSGELFSEIFESFKATKTEV